MNFHVFCILLSISLYGGGHAQRAKDKMYEAIDGYNTCFRRMNATHQIGCSSSRKGSLGVVHFCETTEDIHFVLNTGTAEPYIPVIPTHLFSDVARLLIRSKRVSGILLYRSNTTLHNFTHERKCPNIGYGLENTCEVDWNPYGTGLLYENFPFPLFYTESDTTIEKVRKCFDQFNNFELSKQNDRPLCSLQMNSFMFGTTDTPTCIRRTNIVKKVNLNPPKYCDPLGDQNVWSALFPLVTGLNKTEPVTDYKYIILAARMDTTSLFDKISGAVNPATGLVTLLATAKFLKAMLPTDNNYKKNILFVIFNGETYDYLGSQRFLYEMTKGNFPIKDVQRTKSLPQIKPEDIELFVELSQLNNTGHVVAHFYKNTTEIDALYKEMDVHRNKLHLLSRREKMPPSSAQTFLKFNNSLPSLVLSDHLDHYKNPFYNSIYDNKSSINFEYYNTTDADSIPRDSIQQFLANVTDMTAKSLYSYVTGKEYDGDEVADILVINELLYCYLQSPACKVHQAIQKSTLQDYVVNMYVGVNDLRNQNLFTTLVGLTLGWFTAEDIGEGNSTCIRDNPVFRVYNMSKSIDDLNTTRCFQVMMNFTEAVSPAFIIPDYDWSSGQYSSWTESTWVDISIQLFLKPSPGHEAVSLSLGIIVFVFSLGTMYFMKKRSHVLFTSIPITDADAPTDC